MIEQIVQCEVLENFYDNYYLSRGRTMRKSKNLRVNKYYLANRTDAEGREHVLSHVIFDAVEYRVDRTLVDKLPKKIILDCEQVTT